VCFVFLATPAAYQPFGPQRRILAAALSVQRGVEGFWGVVTDVIMFVEQKLTTFPGTVSEYFGRMSEREDHMSRLRDAKHKQEKKMQAFIASAQSSSSKKPGKAKFIDPKKQKAGAEQAAPLRSITWYVFTVFCAGISQGEESEAGKAGLVPFRWQTVCAQGISSE
jgi:hypothetical protein